MWDKKQTMVFAEDGVAGRNGTIENTSTKARKLASRENV
jgi:hypothetical protein